MAKKNVLGRGLGALIDAANEPEAREVVVSAMQELSLDDIRPNPFQPRTEFDEEALQELAILSNLSVLYSLLLCVWLRTASMKL